MSKKTDALIEEVEKRIQEIYSQANKDIIMKWVQYFAKLDKIDARGNELYEQWTDAEEEYGKLSKEAKDAKETYQNYIKSKTILDKRFKSMMTETSRKITNANEVATKWVNGQLLGVYVDEYNDYAKIANKHLKEDLGVKGTFSLYSEDAVKEVILAELPTKKINTNKDIMWNNKLLNSQILQGIIQGESIPKISKRVFNVIRTSEAGAVRTARTMITSAQNMGRQAMLERQVDRGIKVKKVWMATGDSRTRTDHKILNGQKVDVDKPFKIGGTELMYPADPDCDDPAEVYNCRCTLVYWYPKYQDASEIDMILPEMELADGEIEKAQKRWKNKVK